MPALFLERLEALLVDALAAAPSEVAARWHAIGSPRIADCFSPDRRHVDRRAARGRADEHRSGRTATLTAADAANVYTSHGPAIFHGSVIEKVEQRFGLTAPKYPLEQLRTALEDPAVLGDRQLKHARTNVLILSFDTSIPGLRYFTRWGQPAGRPLRGRDRAPRHAADRRRPGPVMVTISTGHKLQTLALRCMESGTAPRSF